MSLSQEQHKQWLFKAPGALCKLRAESQSSTNSPVTEQGFDMLLPLP